MKSFIICLLLVCTSALAATSGNITITGVVAPNTSVTVTPLAPYSALDLTTTQVDLSVANIVEKNNTRNGYTVTASSLNAGKLKTTQGDIINYTAKYGATTFSLTVAPVVVTTSPPSNAVVNVTKALKISYTGIDPDLTMQGTYNDTLTFTIIAN